MVHEPAEQRRPEIDRPYVRRRLLVFGRRRRRRRTIYCMHAREKNELRARRPRAEFQRRLKRSGDKGMQWRQNKVAAL